MPNIKIGSATGSIVIGGSVSGGNISLSAHADDALFKEIRACIDEISSTEERNKLLTALEELQSTKGKSNFSEKYKNFIQVAANHMRILAPFIPELTKLLA